GDGLRLAKSDDPAAPPASLSETALVGGALAGRVTSGGGVAGDTVAMEGVAVPVMADSAGSRVIGVLVAVRALDDTVVRELQASTESEVLVYFVDSAGRPRVSASTLAPAARARVLDFVRKRRVSRDTVSPIELRL